LSFPNPVPGLVIRYAYSWLAEHRRGREEGLKDRPCAVILVTEDAESERIVTVLPITHTSPNDPLLAVEIPHATKRRLGLDEARSGQGWICAWRNPVISGAWLMVYCRAPSSKKSLPR
jgi:hypothetical protein